MKISYSFGIVDFLHFGHLQALLKAKAGSDLHVFGLMNGTAANRWMGQVVSSFEERKSVLEALECVDEVMEQQSLDPTDNLRQLHSKYPDAEITLFHRRDWKALPAGEYIRSIGGAVELTDYYERLTPENILKILQSESGPAQSVFQNQIISTKANTLLALKPLVKKSEIERIFVVLAKDFFKNEKAVAHKVGELFRGEKIVIRSSSSNEDCYERSNAGHYKSILDIDSKAEAAVMEAIREVFDSYQGDISGTEDEQVLIQSQTKDVRLSGVVFTRDIQENRPYYVVNYDDTGSTDSVTGGMGGKTLWIARDKRDGIAQPWQALLESVWELEELLAGITLDIEFAITHQGKVILFQVRPLAANYRFSRNTNDAEYFDLKRKLKTEYSGISALTEGDEMQLSDMAFWNPAEMIGSNPRCLDYSLYRQLITKSAWNEGLVPMGYREVREELMYKLGNKPYISVDFSFEALTPAAVSEPLARKLIRYYRKKLSDNPTAHDKIEFEITLNCFDFCTEDRLKELLTNGFTEKETEELAAALHDLTVCGIRDYAKVLEEDKAALSKLEALRLEVQHKLPFWKEDVHRMIAAFRELIVGIGRYGTPQFSRQARYAFIARSLCSSMVMREYWTEEENAKLQTSINTVAKELERDLKRLGAKSISRYAFDKLYGHLRSGTYDIRTDRYDCIAFAQEEETALAEEEEKAVSQRWTPDKMLARLEEALLEAKMEVPVQTTWLFLHEAIEQREKFKFEFTKALSDAIEILAEVAKQTGLSRNDMSYLEISDILASEYYQTKEETGKFFRTIIAQRKADYQSRSALVLPDAIWKASDLDVIKINEARPNFITAYCVEGEVCVLDHAEPATDIQNKIIVIEKADPGYDWIFSRNIKGLITKYGGVASHMAIRCAEFDLPAAIGCGEIIYNFATRAKQLVLDCKNGKLMNGAGR